MPHRSSIRPQSRQRKLPNVFGRPANLGSLSGTILTPDQIANVAAGAGFTGDDLVTAVAIALAESDPPGNPDSHNTRGEDSRGLWQINVAARPEMAAYDLYDPQVNAQVAYTYYYLPHGFTPWTTWTKGRYQQFLAAAQQGVIDDARGVSSPPVDSGMPGMVPVQSVLSTDSTNPALTALAITGTILAVNWLVDEFF